MTRESFLPYAEFVASCRAHDELNALESRLDWPSGYHLPVSCTIDIRFVRGPVGADESEPDRVRQSIGVGAECVFLGRTRAETHPEFGDLVALEYEAHESLARSVIEGVARSAAEAHDCLAITVRHSIGRVPLGEASVMIRVLAGHRDSAFAACRCVIDELKAQAPIWKHEHWADGTTWQEGTPVHPAENTRP